MTIITPPQPPASSLQPQASSGAMPAGLRGHVRGGFTLTELLVVIVIIAILAALITVAAGGAMRAAKEARIKTELTQLASAVENYKSKYGSYPPSTSAKLKLHVRALFPRALDTDINGANGIPDNMKQSEILWFVVRGYTSDPTKPVDFTNTAVKRQSDFGFEAGRLVAGPTASCSVYYPQDGKNAPYVYFDLSRTGYTADPDYKYTPVANQGTGVASPYKTAASGPYANAGKFQIISAGVDGDYGAYHAEKAFPDGTNYTPEDNDNLVNFSERNLENSKP